MILDLCIIVSKMVASVKRYVGKTKGIYFLIENDELLIYMTIL